MIILVLSRAGGSRLLDLTSGAVWLGGLACGFVMAFLYVHVYRDLWPRPGSSRPDLPFWGVWDVVLLALC